MAAHTADYIVVGGGLTGCAVASRLSLSEEHPAVTLIEAGPDPTGKANCDTILNGLSLLGGELDYAYQSDPVVATVNRQHTLNAGKTLGGGSILNFGGWLRADAADYDQWGHIVGDKRWSYDGIKPYLDKVETRFHVAPISSDPERQYSLRGPVKAAWKELGVKDADLDTGSISGLCELRENVKDGMRLPSHLAYDLSKVDVQTDTLVQRVTFDGNKATGVLLADGRRVEASKEVIICAGAYRTPQLLMLSGLGAEETLTPQGIPVIHASPSVGKNLFDHFAIYMAFRLRDSTLGHALGTAAWTKPSLFKGLPWDWVVNGAPPAEVLEKHPASFADAEKRALFEVLTLYVAPGIPGIPVDGNHIATSTMLLLPSSRGSVSIQSDSPSAPPKIQPNYLDSDHDKEVLKHAARMTLSAIMGTEALKDIVQSETPPSGPGLEGLGPLTPDVSDEVLEDRIKRTGMQHHHSGGTAAMGKVVDVEGKVIGVDGLRVADGSVVPIPLGGHPQASLYAMAEQLADMILKA
jgi:choline dehydrogenase-like flavoprotein